MSLTREIREIKSAVQHLAASGFYPKLQSIIDYIERLEADASQLNLDHQEYATELVKLSRTVASQRARIGMLEEKVKELTEDRNHIAKLAHQRNYAHEH